MSRILVVNAGSTSLKLSVVDEHDESRAVDSLDAAPRDVDAVAHRVVHGGAALGDPVVVTPEIRQVLDELSDLAPLHNRPALAAIDESVRVLPNVPHVAVFDTAFHRTLPAVASTYAVPARWRDDWGIRRYGFHGLSVQWAAERVRTPRLVVCHLGGGCSLTAVRDGRSIDTTMGFSPLEGLPMATRSGSIDAEIVLHLLRSRRLDLDAIEHALESESGLLALSGESGSVLDLERSGSPDAELALEIFAYRIAAAAAAMTAALGGIDALAFTAGIGEGSARVRRDVCTRLRFLGVDLDESANTSVVPDADVAADSSRVRVHVVHAREDVVAARAARSVIAAL